MGNTAVCKSAITFIDGEKGILRYRGIPIEEFADTPNFTEVAWLLLFGELPNREELMRFRELLTSHELLHEGLRHQFQRIPPEAPSMAQLSATLSNMACFYPEFSSLDDDDRFIEAARSVDQQGSHDLGLCLPAIHGAAGRPSRSESSLLCQLAAHDVLDTLPTVRNHARSRGCAEPDLHPPRRSRTELQHLDRAGCGLGACQSVRLVRGGGQRALGAAARRGQREGGRNARSDSTPAGCLPRIALPRPSIRTRSSCSSASAIASTRTTIPGQKSSKGRATGSSPK